MRLAFTSAIIFLSAPAFGVINAVKDSPIEKQIRLSAVKVRKQHSETLSKDDDACSGVLISQTKVLTAYHCVRSQSQNWKGPPRDAKFFSIEFPGAKGQKSVFVGVKEIRFSKALQEAHKFGPKMDFALEDMEREIKARLTLEGTRKLVQKLGGDPARVNFDEFGETLDEASLEYARNLTGTNKPSPEISKIMDEDLKNLEQEIHDTIMREGKVLVAKILKENNYAGSYEDLFRMGDSNDIVVLEMTKAAPKPFKAATTMNLELREGFDQEAYIAGSGLSRPGIVSPAPIRPILIGRTKITGRRGTQFVVRAYPSRICNGDSGGPMFIDVKGTAKLVGINVQMDYAPGEDPREGLTACAEDTNTYSIDLQNFRDLL